jgi:hypothetical protein
MEVPCCQGLPFIVEKAMEKAGTRIPIDRIVINSSGEIVEKRRAQHR